MHVQNLILAWNATHLAGNTTGTNLTTQSHSNVSGIAAGQALSTLAVSYLQHLQQGALALNHTTKAINLEPWANQNLTKIDPNAVSWVNGTFHGATSKVLHSGVVIEDLYGNKMPLRCRGKTVEQMQEDCTYKAAKYMCNGCTDDNKLRIRDDDSENCKNKTGVIIGGVVGGVGGASLLGGGAFWGWKVHASGHVLTSALGSETASELSVDTLVSDILTKITTSTSTSSSTSLVDVVTQSDLILTNLADQGVTQIGPDLIQPGLQLAQNTLQNVDISCQAGLPIEQATTQAIQQTISEVAPEVLQAVEGGSNIAQSLVDDEVVFVEQMKGGMEQYFEEQNRLNKYKGTRPTDPDTTNSDFPSKDPKDGNSENDGGKEPEKGPENNDSTPPKDPKDTGSDSPNKDPKDGQSGNNGGEEPVKGPDNGNGTPPKDPNDTSSNDPPKDPKDGVSENNGGNDSGSGGDSGSDSPPTGSSGGPPSGSDDGAPKDGGSGNNGGSDTGKDPQKGDGTGPKDPPTNDGQNTNSPPQEGVSGSNNGGSSNQGAGNNHGGPPATATTIETAPPPISQEMFNLQWNTPLRVRNWDTRWSRTLPRVYTDQMNLFPEDFDWEAAIRYWRDMGDLYRKAPDTKTYGPAAHECAKRVIRLGQWRTLWQTWRAAQQHPANPPNRPYTIHRPAPRPTATPTAPVGTVVAPPPASIVPPPVSLSPISWPTVSVMHTPPAPSRTLQKPVTSKPAATIPKITVSGRRTSVPQATVSQNRPATSRTPTQRTSMRSVQTIQKVTKSRSMVTIYTTLPTPSPVVVHSTLTTVVALPAPTLSAPVPEVHHWPEVRCNPYDHLPNGYHCQMDPFLETWIIFWEPDVIYEGKPCDVKNNGDLPLTWICTRRRGTQATLERGYWKKLDCSTHTHIYPEQCHDTSPGGWMEPMDENGVLWDQHV